MRFLSNFGFKIIFMCSVNFWHQQDSNSLFKGSIVTTIVKFQLTKQISRSYAFAMLQYFIQFSANAKYFSTVLDKNVSTCSLRA